MTQETNESTQSSLNKPLTVPKRYSGLRTISAVLLLIAIATLLIVFGELKSLSNYAFENGGWILPAIQFGVGLIVFIILLANSELIHVFIDIEENTRKTSIK